MKQFKRTLFLVLLVIPMTTKGYSQVIRASYVMGTMIEIQVTGASDKMSNEAIDNCFQELRRLNALMSRHLEDSPLNKINRLASRNWVKVDQKLYDVIKASIHYSQITDGAFDITITPLVDLWKASENANHVPKRVEIAKVLKLVNYKDIKIHPSLPMVSFAHKGMSIDLGAIGKGYAISKILTILKNSPFRSIKINFGGQIYLSGTSDHKGHWKVGIRNPMTPKDVLMRVNAMNKSVSTSGGYERYVTIGGKQYSHILNPKTGYPASHILSATVIAKDPVMADALSTALSVMSVKDGLKLIHPLKDVEAVLITKDKTGEKPFAIHLSNGLKGQVAVNKSIIERGTLGERN